MNSFLRLCFILVILLCVTTSLGLDQKAPSRKLTPQLLKDYKAKLSRDFKKAENLNIMFAFLTGDKAGISPRSMKAFKLSNLSYLLSFGGIHLRAILFLTFSVVSVFHLKRLKRPLKFITSLLLIFTQYSPVLARLGVLRLLYQSKFFLKLKFSTEFIFYFCFLISFLMGHFHKAPVGYIFSMGFIGLFIFTQHESSAKRILCIYFLMLLLSFFLKFNVSLHSIILGVIGTFIFSYFFLLILIFLITYPLLGINWIEIPLQLFVDLLKLSTKNVGFLHLGSLPFLMVLFAILFLMNTRLKIMFCLIGLLVHSNVAMAPSLFIEKRMQSKEYNQTPSKNKRFKSHFKLNKLYFNN